jgi:hypothetical protein
MNFQFFLLSFFKIFFNFLIFKYFYFFVFVLFAGAGAAWKESAGSNAEEKCGNGAVRRQGFDLQQSERSSKYFPEILTKFLTRSPSDFLKPS